MKHFFSILIFILLLSVEFVFADNSPDSLENSLSKTTESGRAKIFNELSRSYIRTDIEKSLAFAKKARENALKFKNKQEEGNACLNIGLYYYQNSEFKTALKYFQSGKEIFKQINFTDGLAASLNDIGLVYDTCSDYKKSLQCYTEALSLLEKTGFEEGISSTLINISRIYYNLKNYKKSLEYLEKNIAVEEKLGNNENIATSLNNIAIIFVMQGDFQKALNYYNRVLEIYNKRNNSRALTGVYHNVGNVYLSMKDFVKAKFYLEKALSLAKEFSDENLITETYYSLGELNFYTNKFDEAIIDIEQSITSAAKSNNKAQLLSSYKLYSDVLEKKGDFKKALEYFKLNKELSDSVFSNDMRRQISDFQVKYETDNKEKQISILTKEKEIQRLTINKQFAFLLLFISVSILLIIVALLIYSRFKIKKRTSAILERNNEELHEANATKDKIFSIVVHDLKNPVDAFYGILNLLSENYTKLDDEQKLNLLQKLNISAKGLLELMNNISQWSLLKRGKQVFTAEKVNVYDIVNQTINVLSANADKKNISLTNEIAADTSVLADKNMFFTICCNLISNAIKFCNPQGQVIISASMQENFWEIKIADNGVGINKENLSHLFRVDSHISTIGTSKERGTGLGLIICKEFIEKCGGRIKIESEINKGTQVNFTLPAVQ